MEWLLLMWVSGADMEPLQIAHFPTEKECRSAAWLFKTVAGMENSPEEKDYMNLLLLSGLDSKCLQVEERSAKS